MEYIARQAPLPMRFSRQEYWSELPFPPPGNPPDPGIEPAALVAPAQADSLPLSYFYLKLKKQKIRVFLLFR